MQQLNATAEVFWLPCLPACLLFLLLLQGDRALDRILPRPYVQQWKELDTQVRWGSL